MPCVQERDRLSSAAYGHQNDKSAGAEEPGAGLDMGTGTPARPSCSSTSDSAVPQENAGHGAAQCWHGSPGGGGSRSLGSCADNTLQGVSLPQDGTESGMDPLIDCLLGQVCCSWGLGCRS